MRGLVFEGLERRIWDNMKKIINVIECIALLLCVFFLFKMSKINNYDVNRDGKVDSKDLLNLKQYLLERLDYENN